MRDPAVFAQVRVHPELGTMLGGYMFNGPEDRRRLLKLLLVQVGLVEAVKLVPEQRWQEALERAYG